MIEVLRLLNFTFKPKNKESQACPDPEWHHDKCSQIPDLEFEQGKQEHSILKAKRGNMLNTSLEFYIQNKYY